MTVTCIVCGKKFQALRHAPVRTHIRCRIPGELADDLLMTYERFQHHVTMSRLARDFGVKLWVMAAWLRWALERRRERTMAYLRERGAI